MKTFKQLMLESKKVKTVKIGKEKFDVMQNGSKFDLMYSGEKVDTFKSIEDAEKGAKDFERML